MRILAVACVAIGMAWALAPSTARAQAVSQCPDDYGAYRDDTTPLACICPAEMTRAGSVYGTDVYTSDSGVCRAALHAGRVARAGGPVTVVGEPGRRAYPGTTRNGVTSFNYGQYGWSFRFAGDAAAAPAPAPAPAPAAAAAPSQCPDNYMAFKDETDPLACVCPAEMTQAGAVWGTDVYTGDTAVCRAALHAGRVGRNGGLVTVIGEPGRRAYPGTTRNGVASQNYGPYESSFRFAGGPAPAAASAPAAPPTPPPPAPAAAVAAAPAAPSQCPDNYMAYKDETDPLACVCPAEMTQSGAVWGTDVYTGDTAVCRAAVHAGRVGRNGGLVTVIGEPGRRAYPGTTRNGVASNNYGPYEWSFRFGGAAPVLAVPAAAASARPAVQAGPMQCPDNASAFKEETAPVACVCPSESTSIGSVWGTDVYTADSGLCKAAVHAGMITRLGGAVTFVAEPGRRAYPGTTRNGIASSNYGPYDGSFRFEGQPARAAPSVPVQAAIGDSLRASGKVNLYVQFRTASADLDIGSAPVLTELLGVLRAEPSLRLRLIGHTDSQGTRAINGPLSARRAAAVKDWLVAQGVDGGRLTTDGRGQDEPLAPNISEEGRALNRRVAAALAK